MRRVFVMRHFHLADIMRMREDRKREYNKVVALSKEHLERIERHRDTSKIKYSDYPKAFDYVDNLFPDAHVNNINKLI